MKSSNSLVVILVALLWPVAAPSGRRETQRRNGADANGRTALDETLDRFGGVPMRVSKPSGFFHAQRVGNRWVLVTPEGNAFWMTEVAMTGGEGGKVFGEMLRTKYGNKAELFREHVAQRLRSWGFNAGDARQPTQGSGPGQLAFIRGPAVAWYGSFNSWNFAPQAFKTLIDGGVDPQVYKGGWPGHFPDPFDPNFEAYAYNLARDRLKPFASQPWLIGVSIGDSDYLFGFGPGPEMPGIDGVIHPHLGWIVAVTRPTQTQNQIGRVFGPAHTVSYPDPTVYAKAAWRDFLRRKYSTIEALNQAWGSSYTTFDSDGGWPMGRGLMDESGRNSWIGSDWAALATAHAMVKADLDGFLEILAGRFFSVMSGAFRSALPHHLVFGPQMLNSHRGLTRRQILRAAGRYCDVIEMSTHPSRPELIAVTYQEARRPMVGYVALMANADSGMYAYPGKGSLSFSTQAERAAMYVRQVDTMFGFAASDGTHPMVGLDWWEYMDKPGEKANWGLVSLRDNAYDGKEAVIAEGRDPWGYPTGGEERNYGDFLTVVRQTNFDLFARLRQELQAPAGATSARDQ